MQLDTETEASTGRPINERAPQISITTQPARLLDERQAAELLRCSVALLRKMRRERSGLTVTRISRLVRYSECDLAVFIAANRGKVA
jgi:hypothetical protein